MSEIGPQDGLTAHELRILELIGDGLTNRQIGERLFLAEQTVKNYVSALFTKLGMERRTQAAAYAARLHSERLHGDRLDNERPDSERLHSDGMRSERHETPRRPEDPDLRHLSGPCPFRPVSAGSDRAAGNDGGWPASDVQVARVRRHAEPRNSHGSRLRGALAARWPDRNPLRRPIDRIEAVAMIMLVVAFLAGAPFAAAVTSAWARHGAEAAARVERATWHPVDAVVLLGVPAPTSPYGQESRVRVPVRWTLNGTGHAGLVAVAPGTPAGATVRVWTGPSGDQTGPPLSPPQITHQATLAGVISVAGLAFVLIVSAVVIRRILDRRRMAAWDAEWSATGPQWCKYR